MPDNRTQIEIWLRIELRTAFERMAKAGVAFTPTAPKAIKDRIDEWVPLIADMPSWNIERDTPRFYAAVGEMILNDPEFPKLPGFVSMVKEQPIPPAKMIGNKREVTQADRERATHNRKKILETLVSGEAPMLMRDDGSITEANMNAIEEEK